MLSELLPQSGLQRQRYIKRWIIWTAGMLVVIAAGWAIIPHSTPRSLHASTRALTEVELDHALQAAAVAALGDTRGTIIVIDPQTGRVRAVVNPEIAFGESLPPGSTVKPFTTLAALNARIIDGESRTLCREEYSHDDFHTVCAHPRGLSPLSPTDALAYSCNYYFGKVGERLNEPEFVSTLATLGFGKKTGVNFHGEPAGKLVRGGWHSRNAIGETENFYATPIQVLTAYSAIANGGRLLVPQVSGPTDFVPKEQSEFELNGEQRALIVKGMRGAVRYGTAESAVLYGLPNYIFGKTGTATQINGFRTQGWFVGFASDLCDEAPEDSELEAQHIKLGVLVFLSKAHGSDAAKTARRMFEEYSRARPIAPQMNAVTTVNPPVPRSSRATDEIKVHSISENTTRTITLEDYVVGVVAAEGSTENQQAALQALAIASRTYALRNRGRHALEGYDFCSSTHCQRYIADQPNSISSAVVEAVRTSAGETLRDNRNQLADSYFSASCGGATANVATLWGGSAPLHLRGVEDEYCSSDPHDSWTDVISTEQLQKAMQSDRRTNVGGPLVDVRVYRRDRSGRAQLVAIKGTRERTISGWDFKIVVGRALGWNILKSSRFEIARSGSNFVFRGSGFGHGLGLCQKGAHVMASRGATYKQILSKYFPGARINRDDGSSWSADLLWTNELRSTLLNGSVIGVRGSRRNLSGEQLRVSYPASIEQREVESLLSQVQSHRRSLNARLSAAGLPAQLPAIEIFINETTGDFVGRTGQPPWAAAASKGNRIELQPIAVLKRRNVLTTTLRHELVHVAVDAVAGGRTPRWLAEGLAVYFAGEGPMVSRGVPPLTNTEQIEQKLASANTPEEMKAAYAAAYAEVRRLINTEGETNVWRRLVRNG